MPVPNTKGNPPRIVIQYPAPTVDAGRYPAKRVVGDTVRVTADVFRDGHEILRAVVRYRGPGSRRWVESAMRPIDAHVNGVRWEGEFPVDMMGRWQWSIEAWSDVFATWRDELQRKIAAGAGGPRGRAVRGRRAAGAGREPSQGRRQEDDRGGARRAQGPQVADRLRARARPVRRHGARLRAHRRVPARHARRSSRSTASPPPSPPGTSSSRAAGAASRRSRSRSPRSPSSASTSSTSRRSTRSASKARKGRNNTLTAGKDDPGSPYAIGGKEGGHDAVHPELGTHGRRPQPHRHRARARDGRRARPRAQLVTRPPVAQGPPGVVPAAPRRHAQVRREPAQALPGHLQLQLGHAGLARAVAGVARRRHPLGRRRHQVLPRRQPAHQAVPVLGVADQGGPRARPQRGLPRRGVHPPRRHAPAGEDRLHPVLHVLHLEELPLGAERVRQRARPRAGARVLPPQLLHQHAGHPARLPPARRAAGVRLAARAGRHAQPHLRHLLGLRVVRERAGARGLGGVPELREVRDPRAGARRPAAPDGPPHQRDPPREPRAAAARERHLHRLLQRGPDRVCQVVAGQHGDLRREHRPPQHAGGRRRHPRPSRPPARVRGQRSAVGQPLRLAHRGQLRASSSRAAPTCCGSSSERPRPLVRARAAVVQDRRLLRDPHPRLLRRQRRRLG